MCARPGWAGRAARASLAAVAALLLVAALMIRLGLHWIYAEDDDGMRYAVVSGALALVAAMVLLAWFVSAAAIVVVTHRAARTGATKAGRSR